MSRQVYSYSCWLILTYETFEGVLKKAQDELEKRIKEAIKNWDDVSFDKITLVEVPDDSPQNQWKVN